MSGMLDSGFWKLGCRRDDGVWAARILYSVFCILPAEGGAEVAHGWLVV